MEESVPVDVEFIKGQLDEADAHLTNLPDDLGSEFDSAIAAARSAVDSARAIALKKGESA